MERTIEQRVSIKFCVKLKKTATETLKMIQEAFGEDALSRTQVFEWHKNFRDGREDVHDEQRIGRPVSTHTDANVKKVRDVLNNDRRLSIRMIADEVGIDKMTVHNIITNDLGMRKICAKLVPKVLTDEQKERRVAVASEMIDRLQTESEILDRVISGDESWVFKYDPETKRQSTEWHTLASP
ncbi:protein GVQW3-like [Daktulosphaira vitifoliae]|uniref:protein GVQW3-like n=1 Tax=Daktulosphaira vitifoliae TaxID=58002 RepID=UPI0021A996F5|nr:protein GVQW3-like [Daktulosphaira vitifoliae]